MFRYFIVILISVFSFQTAFATAMSEERSKCMGLHSLASRHSAWKEEFHRFQSDTSLNEAIKFELYHKTLRLVLDRLIHSQELSDMESNNRDLISDTTRFLRDLEMGAISHRSAFSIMKSAVPKFEDALDEAFVLAQMKNQTCEIVEN